MSSLKKQYKASFAIIKNAVDRYGSTSDGYKASHNAEMSAINENFYIIRKAYYESAPHYLSKGKLFLCIQKYLARNGWAVSRETFFDFFNNTDLSISDVFALGTIIRCALTISVADEIRMISTGCRCRYSKLISSVGSFRKIDDIPLEECFSRLCKAERYMLENAEEYSKNDIQSKNQCREALMKYASKKRKSDIEALKSLEKRNMTVYSLTDDGKKHALPYFAAYALVFFLLVAFGAVFTKWLVLFSLLPLYLTSGMICDRIFASFVKAKPPLRLDIDCVPNNSAVLAVTVTLLFGSEKDKSVFDNIESFYLRNKADNIYFAVLGDFPDSKSEINSFDKPAAEYAVMRISKLNEAYGNRFALFIRNRYFNERDKIWGGRERKRGAVCDIVNAIIDKNISFAYSVNSECLGKIKYILTLDGDTSLPMESIKELVGIMLHPKNKPVVKNGRVVEGYGILQPKIKTGLTPSYETYYSLLRSEEAGFYESASFDRYQSVLGSGVFCGKGIFDALLFKQLVIPAFPEKAILSHDIPEGCILRCMFVPDVVFTDSAPKNAISFFSRLHRWIRGDIQNAVFLNKKAISPDGKYKLAENIIRHLTPLASAAGMIICGIFCSKALSFGAVSFICLQSYNVFPAVMTVFSHLTKKSYTPRRFFSVMFSSAFKSLVNLLIEFSSVFEYAFRTLDAFTRSSWRMLISKKNLLQWVAFSQSDRSIKSVTHHISSLVCSWFSGCILVVFSDFLIYKLLGLVTFMLPLTSFFLSQSIVQGSNRINGESKEKLRSYAKDAYGFFSHRTNRSTNYLPPDNVQLSPADVTAYRTSPTNIGFYLLSVVSAVDFGFITEDEALKRIKQTLGTVEKLKKLNGHLYNWYDIKTLLVLGVPYVSTVDSGNFVTMLITLSQALKHFKNAEPELILRIDRLVDETDFAWLYNKEKNLFYLGYSEKDGFGSICYDMLMSEIRTACYYACACGITPKRHWTQLSREVTAKNGFIGMVSWSGSAFEYFMPQLFLPSNPNSFIDESLEFALYNQKSYRKDKIWGVSESGYYAFDADMNYQYRANGVPSLALKRYREDEFVFSPYSSFLMVEGDAQSVLKNLEAMSEMGMYGEYGFYEAIDLSDSDKNEKGIVRSYMAHHTGMIILACANACLDGIVRKRFMSDKRLSACRELLCERIPTSVYLFPKSNPYPKKSTIWLPCTENRRVYSPLSPTVFVNRKSNSVLVSSSDGRVSPRYGDYLLCDGVFEKQSNETGVKFGFYGTEGTKLCLPSKNNRFCAESYTDGFAFVSSSPNSPCVVRGKVSNDGKGFIFDVKCESGGKYGFCIYFRPVLEKAEVFYAHPAFSKLFIISSYLENEKVIIFRRKGESKLGRYPICAVGLTDLKCGFVFRTDEEHLLSHSRPTDGSLFDIDYDCKTGICINPACYIRTDRISSGSMGFVIASAFTEEECVDTIRRARLKTKDKRKYHYLSAQTETAISSAFFPRNVYGNSKCDTSVLWKAGVSGDSPLLTLGVFGESMLSVSSFLQAFGRLRDSFIGCELLFLIHEPQAYSSPLADYVVDCIKEQEYESFISRKNGIFVVNSCVFNDEEKSFIKDFSCLYSETDSPFTELGEEEQFIRIIRSLPQPFSEKLSPDKVTVTGTPRLPHSYIMAGYSSGTVVTEKTLGFTFGGNAGESKISSFIPDPFLPSYGEELLVNCDGNVRDVIATSDSTVYKNGVAEYSGVLFGREYKVKVFVIPKLPVKVIATDFGENSVSQILCVKPDGRSNYIFPLKNRTATAWKQMKHSEKQSVSFVYQPENGKFCCDKAACIAGSQPKKADWGCGMYFGSKGVFYIGSAPNEESAERIIQLLTKENAERFLSESIDFAKSLIPPFTLFSSDGSTDAIYSVFAPYQTASSRFLGRTGFYQIGGAYGFRDQLQDCLCLVYSRPDLVRSHIIRCACRQYREGDVMHWWNDYGKAPKGIRSKCSDDLLFLPLVSADYAEKTGDMSVFNIKVPYLVSAELKESERYETPDKTENTETVYMHCLRGIFRSSEQKGAHGLCLMGSCDWNDGFSAVGNMGKGESVFTTLLLSLTARRFARISESFCDGSITHKLLSIAEKTEEAVSDLFDTDRFPRGYFDNGSSFGVSTSEECSIDILSQCFAAAVMGENSKTKKAMNTAYSLLFDKEKSIFKLFSPPFDKINAGYISDYPKGIRENGGQYTHGAVWGVWGLVRCGEYDKALEVMKSLSPAYHAEKFNEYKLESYVLPADIYQNGRGGWSWYTGSASWYFKIMTEEILGIRFSDGFTKITVSPIAEYTFISDKNNRRLKIISSFKEQSSTLDGIDVSFPLYIPEGEHILRVRTLSQ